MEYIIYLSSRESWSRLGDNGVCSRGRPSAESHWPCCHVNEDRVMQITLKQVSGEWASCLPQAGKHFEVPRQLLRKELKPRREEMRCPPPPRGGAQPWRQLHAHLDRQLSAGTGLSLGCRNYSPIRQICRRLFGACQNQRALCARRFVPILKRQKRSVLLSEGRK